MSAVRLEERVETKGVITVQSPFTISLSSLLTPQVLCCVNVAARNRLQHGVDFKVLSKECSSPCLLPAVNDLVTLSSQCDSKHSHLHNETSFLVRISGPLLLLVPMFLPPLCPSRRRRGGQFVILASLGMASAPRSASGTAMGSGDGF